MPPLTLPLVQSVQVTLPPSLICPASQLMQSLEESCSVRDVPSSDNIFPAAQDVQSSTESCRAALDASSDWYLHAHDKM